MLIHLHFLKTAIVVCTLHRPHVYLNKITVNIEGVITARDLCNMNVIKLFLYMFVFNIFQFILGCAFPEFFQM